MQEFKNIKEEKIFKRIKIIPFKNKTVIYGDTDSIFAVKTATCKTEFYKTILDVFNYTPKKKFPKNINVVSALEEVD
jgi:DNA polymerase elongation subunit (family B)